MLNVGVRPGAVCSRGRGRPKRKSTRLICPAPMPTLFSKLLPLDLDRNVADPRRDGAPIRAIREVMKDPWLYWGALTVAYVGVAAFNVSLLSVEIRSAIVLPISIVESVAAAAILIRSAFDSRFRSGFATATRQIIAFRRRTPWRNQFFDPYWGMFSPYWGPKPIRLLQLLVLFELLGAIVFLGRGWGDLVYLLFAAFFVSSLLESLYVGLNTEPDDSRW